MCNASLPRQLLASFLTALLVLACAQLAAAQDATVSPGESIRAAIDNASSGDVIEIQNGTYTPDSRIDNFKTGMTLRGESRAGVVIDGSNLPENAWGIAVLSVDNVTLEDFTFEGSAAAGHAENIKVDNNSGFTLQNVTAKGSPKSEIAISLNSTNVTVTNVTADGQNTAGVGFALSGVDDVTLDGVTTKDNNWGGVGIYDAANGGGSAVPAQNVIITGGTFSEDVPVYADAEHGATAQNLKLDGFGYAAENPDYDGRGEDYVFYFKQESAAIVLALTSPNPEKSTIQTLGTNGSGFVQQDNNFIVGTSGGSAMSIQTAIDAASTDGTVNVNDGTYTPGSRIDGLPSGLTLTGESRSGVVIDGSGLPSWGIYVQENVDNVTLENFTIEKSGGENIKVNKNDGFTLQNVTSRRSAKSEIAISRNSTDVTVTNVTADGNDASGNITPGVGIAISGASNVTLTDITTMGNKYGSVGLYDSPDPSDSSPAPVVRTTNVTVTGNNSFSETVTVYSDAEFGKPAQNLTLDGFGYAVENPDHRANLDQRGEDLVYYKQTEAGAVGLALGQGVPEDNYFDNPQSSTIQTLSRDGSGVISQENNFIVGTSGGSAMSIQTAIDSAATGATVNVGAGTYAEPFNIEGLDDITISGASKSSVILEPTSTLGWNVGGIGNGRQTGARVVDATNVTLENMTFDFHQVEGSQRAVVLFWDATGTITNNILKNNQTDDNSGGQRELGAYVRATGYSHSSRAAVTINDNEFVDVGRVAVNLNDFVDVTIDNNEFHKTEDDFGYAIEVGSESIATVSGNTIYGFDTQATDESPAAGVYVNNSFTNDITSGFTKNVTVSGNEVYDSQVGVQFGNGYDGLGGPVQIAATFSNNNVHDNTDYGVIVRDEDKEAGSSVSVSGGGNTIENNGTNGYAIATEGDGDITVAMQDETITGHDTGVLVQDAGGSSSNSVYDVSVTQSRITDNANYALNNTLSSQTVNARNNYWGDVSGPSGGLADAVNTSVVANGSGDAIAASSGGGIRFDPWTGQAETKSVTDTGEDVEYEDGDVKLSFSTLPPGGGDVTVQTTPDDPAQTPPGDAVGLTLDITSTMTDYDFDVEITVEVSGYSGFGPDTRLAYLNDSGSYVTVPGTYDAGDETFTFTTAHFTPFVFFNNGEVVDVYVSTDPNTAEAGTVVPHDAWTSPSDNDWDFTSSPTVEFYIVPGDGSEFAASDVTVLWDETKLDFISADKTGGIYDGSDRAFQVNQLGSPNTVLINGSRLDNQNFTTSAGDYIAKLSFEVKQPGHSPVALTSLDFRGYDGAGGQADVVTSAHSGEVKAYLGDVATAGTDTTGDGIIDFEDLTPFSTAYWSGVPGYSGADNYKVKYDVGPTADGSVYSLPQKDGQIDFEDLVIFSISYGLSGDDIYPQIKGGDETPQATEENPVVVDLKPAQVSGGEVHVPVHVSAVRDLRAAQLQLADVAGPLELAGAQKAAGGLIGSDRSALLQARSGATGQAVSDAAVFSRRGVSGEGVLYTLRLRPEDGASASEFAGRKDLVKATGVTLRNSRNDEISASLASGVATDDALTPTEFTLKPNYPNPFGASTTIRYALPEARDVTITVYDALGRQVAQLVNQRVGAGTHTATWNAEQASSGVYVYRIEAGSFRDTRSMTLAK